MPNTAQQDARTRYRDARPDHEHSIVCTPDTWDELVQWALLHGIEGYRGRFTFEPALTALLQCAADYDALMASLDMEDSA